jgi:hypothetical protein
MPDYRRNRVRGGTYFFTVNLLYRRSNPLVTNIDALRDAVRRVRAARLFTSTSGRLPRPHALFVDAAARRFQFSGSVPSDQDRVREIAANRQAAIT